MQTTHHLNIGTFLNSLGTQFQDTFNTWHIRIPNLLPIIIFVLCLSIVVFLLRRIVNLIRVIREDQILLELTPPAFTQKESYTTQQLFLVLHDIGRQLTFFDRYIHY